MATTAFPISTPPQPLFPNLVPGGNVSGSNVSTPASSAPVPMPPASFGGSTNPFLYSNIGTGTLFPTFPGGLTQTTTPSSAPPAPVPGSFPANTGGVPAGAVPGATPGGLPGVGGVGGTGVTSVSDLQRGLDNILHDRQLSGLIAQFLAGGAGFNPQVAQALIAQMQPYMERQQENLMEQFSAYGNRFGSPAAIGMADLQSQQFQDMNAVFAQMYEQSVQNYMNVLMGLAGEHPGAGAGFPTGSAITAGATIGAALI